ncbi:MAG TPA: hypothetical protein VF516_45240 [Kofleriaceae bacterium]
MCLPLSREGSNVVGSVAALATREPHSGPNDGLRPAAGPWSPRCLHIADARVYEDLVEVEALAVTADEAVTNLPPKPLGKYSRTMARLYTLVSKTSGRAQDALERGEELVAQIAAARGGKRRAR